MCLPFHPISLTCIFLLLPQGFVLRLFQTGRQAGEGFAFKCVRENEVFAAIMSKGSEAMGTNGSLLNFIKIVLHEILSVFTHLFNFWKMTLVLPLPKCGSPTIVFLIFDHLELPFFLYCLKGLRCCYVISLWIILTMAACFRPISLGYVSSVVFILL
jgi:hypothetical protein